MRRLEKIEARKLREQGKSIKEIEKLIGIRRSSISVWVRDISLTAVQKRRLAGRGHSLEVTERRRQSRLSNETRLRTQFLHEGFRDIETVKEIDLLMLGIGLYWGEGSKTNRGSIELSNTDPRVIRIHVLFLTSVFKFPMSKIHAHVGLHSHLSIKKAERYWSKVSGIPLRQFQKTSMQRSKSGKGERDRLPFGTFTVGVYDTAARIRLEGWIQAVYKRLFPTHYAFHDLTKLRI